MNRNIIILLVVLLAGTAIYFLQGKNQENADGNAAAGPEQTAAAAKSERRIRSAGDTDLVPPPKTPWMLLPMPRQQ